MGSCEDNLKQCIVNSLMQSLGYSEHSINISYYYFHMLHNLLSIPVPCFVFLTLSILRADSLSHSPLNLWVSNIKLDTYGTQYIFIE